MLPAVLGGGHSRFLADTASFLANNAPLIFGSTVANKVVTYTSNIDLKTGVAGSDNLLREIRDIDNVNYTADNPPTRLQPRKWANGIRQ